MPAIRHTSRESPPHWWMPPNSSKRQENSLNGVFELFIPKRIGTCQDCRQSIKSSAWGGSSAGRASRSQCEGREFDPPPLHHDPKFHQASVCLTYGKVRLCSCSSSLFIYSHNQKLIIRIFNIGSLLMHHGCTSCL